MSVYLECTDTHTHTRSIIQSLIKTFDGLYVFVLFFYILPPDEETRCVTQCMLCDCIGQQRPTWNGTKGQWVSTLHWTVVSKLIPMYQVWWQLNGVCIQNVLEQKKAAQFGLFMRSTPLHLPPPRTSESFSKMKSNSFSVTSGVKVLVMQTRSSIQISNPI